MFWQRDRHTRKKVHTHSMIDLLIDRKAGSLIDRQAKIYTERQIDSYRQTERQTERLTNRKTNKQVDQHTYIWSDSWTKRINSLTD